MRPPGGGAAKSRQGSRKGQSTHLAPSLGSLYDKLGIKSPEASAPASGDIGSEKAKAAALAHAGLSEAQVSGMRVEPDQDDGRLEYEVQFRAGGMEYEYTIDGASGAILEHEQDRDD